jgi:hypothetical protein
MHQLTIKAAERERPAKNKVRFTVLFFSLRFYDRLLPTFTTQFTTTSPQKNHQLHRTFPETPLKIPVKQQNPGADRLAPGLTFFSYQPRHCEEDLLTI